MRERIYSIKDLEVITGIKAHTIRIWEKRYSLLEPDRTDTNIRLYSDRDLRKLLNVAFLVHHGYRISKVSTWSDEEIAGEIMKLTARDNDEETLIDQMTVHMVNFDGYGFEKLTGNILEKYGFDEAIKRVIFPFFEKLGIFWQMGSIFPAQEHFVSNLFRQKLIVEIDKLGPGSPDQEIMLFYLHEEEMHELSLLFYSYIARKHGYKVFYLGQNVPMDDLRRLGTMDQIKSVFTVFINSIAPNDLEKYLKELREAFPGRRIFISGRQIKELQPEIPEGITVIESYTDFENR